MGGRLNRQAKRLCYGGGVFFAVWAAVSMVRLLAAPGPLWLRVDRTKAYAPTQLIVDVHVVPEDDDRFIWLAAESEDEVSRSEIPLFDGARSRRTYHWVWPVRRPGDYVITARVGHGALVRAEATTRMLIP